MTTIMQETLDSAGQRARQKEESLRRILDAGAARLRADGPDGGAIAQVMKDAGLTHGAFYSHFDSKEALGIAAFRHALAGNRPRWIGEAPERTWSARVARLARGYLNRRHRDERADSCAFSALATDAPRMSDEFRAAYEQELRKSLNAMGLRPLDEAGEHENYDDAIAVLALSVGGLLLARAVKSETFSSRILKVCRTAAERMGIAAERRDPNA